MIRLPPTPPNGKRTAHIMLVYGGSPRPNEAFISFVPDIQVAFQRRIIRFTAIHGQY